MVPGIKEVDIIKLQFGSNLSMEEELGILTMLAIGLKCNWERRLKLKMIKIFKMT